MKDDLGDRIKSYESVETDRFVFPRIPFVARMDGRAFHSVTKKYFRKPGEPFSELFNTIMSATAKHVLKMSGANIAYVQSDEISLVWKNDKIESEVMFNGKIFKLETFLAASASVVFVNQMAQRWSQRMRDEDLPTFDCRVFSVPNLVEAANYLVWREQDAIRNSVQMLAQSLYSHAQLNEVPVSKLKEMIIEKCSSWECLPMRCKRGAYFRRETVLKPFSAEELEKMPPKHAARSNPNLVIERQEIMEVDMPFLSPEQNKIQLLFPNN